jgi:hypothetical protein
MVGAMDEAPILDTDAHPDVWRPRQFGRQLGHSLGPLREHLEDVVVRLGHDL